MAKKTTTTTVRMTTDEKALLKAKADDLDIGMSTFLKKAGFDYEITLKPRIVYKKSDPTLIRHISWAGNNLNQIAHRLNAMGFAGSDRFTLAILLEDISDQLRGIQNGDI